MEKWRKVIFIQYSNKNVGFYYIGYGYIRLTPTLGPKSNSHSSD